MRANKLLIQSDLKRSSCNNLVWVSTPSMIIMTEEKKYKVLARKYRPQKFEDLVGQELLVKILSNAINNDRLAHAYILTGVRGVGKTTTARLIAMSINCKNRDKKIVNHAEIVIHANQQLQTAILMLLRLMQHRILELMTLEK